jgi:hypothetical protein
MFSPTVSTHWEEIEELEAYDEFGDFIEKPLTSGNDDADEGDAAEDEYNSSENEIVDSELTGASSDLIQNDPEDSSTKDEWGFSNDSAEDLSRNKRTDLNKAEETSIASASIAEGVDSDPTPPKSVPAIARYRPPKPAPLEAKSEANAESDSKTSKNGKDNESFVIYKSHPYYLTTRVIPNQFSILLSENGQNVDSDDEVKNKGERGSSARSDPELVAESNSSNSQVAEEHSSNNSSGSDTGDLNKFECVEIKCSKCSFLNRIRLESISFSSSVICESCQSLLNF